MPDTTVIREVAPNIWIFSVPFSIGILPIGGRSTAIKLSSGGVWLLASHDLDEPTKAKLAELGPVEYIVSADADHHFFLPTYVAAFPSAKLIGVEPLLAKKPDLKFDGVYGRDAPETKYGFENEIEAVFFPGHTKKDVAFFHVASKSMIEADLLFNFPCTEQFSKTSKSGGIPVIGGFFKYNAFFHRRIVNGFVKDRTSIGKSAKEVAAWDFNRIIPCHGDVVETGGKDVWNDVFGPYMK